MADYVLSNIALSSYLGWADVNVYKGHYYVATYANCKCTLTAGGDAYTNVPLLQPRIAAYGSDFDETTGYMTIIVYIYLEKEYSYYNGNTHKISISNTTIAGETVGTTATRILNNDSSIPASSDNSYSYALGKRTYKVAPGKTITPSGQVTFTLYGGSTKTIKIVQAEDGHETIFRNPYTTKKTITFKTDHSSIKGTSTYSKYAGSVMSPDVNDDTVTDSTDGTKTVYLNFVSNGGSSVAQKSSDCKTKTETTYKFNNWDNGTQPGYYFEIYNGTVNALWKDTGSSTSVTSKASFSGFETPTRDGYKFAGWYDSNDTDATKKTAISTDQDTTLYAKWYPIMNFDSGVSGINPTQKTVSSKLDGIDFTWPNLTKKSYFVNGTKNISISYDSQGGSDCSPTSLTCNTSTTWTADDCWYWTGGSNTWVTLGGTGAARAGSFIAHWSAGETSVKEVAIGTLPTPTRTGYTFKGWTYNGADVSKSTKFSNNATLTAKWTPVTYTVTYNLNAGSSAITPTSIDSITKTYGTNAKISDETPKFNDGSKKFSYWSCSGKIFYPSGTLTDAFYQTGVSKYELTANWAYVPYTVNFVYYNGSWKNPDQRTYTKADVENTWRMPTPIWDNHSFVGWTTVVPSNFWNTGGVYESIDDIESSVTNNLINPYEVTISMPDRYTPWGNTTILSYYGVWVKTGKKLKIQKDSQSTPEWVDIQSMYIKTDSGWQRVKDLWVKTANGWKHEI